MLKEITIEGVDRITDNIIEITPNDLRQIIIDSGDDSTLKMNCIYYGGTYFSRGRDYRRKQ